MPENLTASELRAAGFAAARTFDKEQRNLREYLLVARAVWEAARAAAAEADADAVAAPYRLAAFNTAYNIAAACWPGWGEGQAHADLSREQVGLGLEFARAHLALLEHLALPAQRQANAHWIVAAHLLAAGALEASREEFELCHQVADRGGVEDTALMARGWMHVIDVLQGRVGAGEALSETSAALESLGEDGLFYAAQFAPALKVFAQLT